VNEHLDKDSATSKERLQEQARSYTESAKEQVSRAKDEGKARLEQQKHSFAEEIEGVVNALRSSATQLQNQEQRAAAGYVTNAADGLENISHSLRDQDFDALVGRTEEFARRQPGVFFGGAVAAGFLLARFLKSSQKRVSPPSETRSGQPSVSEQSGSITTAQDIPPSSTTTYP
jgi:ElaB/YqjD/DUF883 family membrane-anchored ribosome-binding protein